MLPEDSDLEEVRGKNIIQTGQSNADVYTSEPAVIYSVPQEREHQAQIIDDLYLHQSHVPESENNSNNITLPSKQQLLTSIISQQQQQQQQNKHEMSQLIANNTNTSNNIPLKQSTPGFIGTLPALHSPLAQMVATSIGQFSVAQIQQILQYPQQNNNGDIPQNQQTNNFNVLNSSNNNNNSIGSNRQWSKNDGDLYGRNVNLNNNSSSSTVNNTDLMENNSRNSSLILDIINNKIAQNNNLQSDNINQDINATEENLEIPESEEIQIVQVPLQNFTQPFFDIYFGWSALMSESEDEQEPPQIEFQQQKIISENGKQQNISINQQNGSAQQIGSKQDFQIKWPYQRQRSVQFPPNIARLFGIPSEPLQEPVHVGADEIQRSLPIATDSIDEEGERVQIKFNAEIVIERGQPEDFASLQSGCVSYLTNGPSQLAIDEGLKLQAPNGEKFIIVPNAQQCATACEVMVQRCGDNCCDSVAYNKQKMECYLKKGGSRFSSSFNELGWQTFWRASNQSTAEEEASVDVLQVCGADLQVGQYGSAYLSRGYGQLAVFEGNNISMSDGSKYKQHISIQSCALECEKVSECDSVSYNLNGRKCYLKGSGQRFKTRISEDGWSTYWRTDDTIAKVNCQKPGWFCLYCKGNYGNQCRNY